jgi:hypothetical protein
VARTGSDPDLVCRVTTVVTPAIKELLADLAEPSPLPDGLDGPAVVVAANPGECLAWGEAVEDGQCRQGGSGAADAAAAGDLDALPGECAAGASRRASRASALSLGTSETWFRS